LGSPSVRYNKEPIQHNNIDLEGAKIPVHISSGMFHVTAGILPVEAILAESSMRHRRRSARSTNRFDVAQRQGRAKPLFL